MGVVSNADTCALKCKGFGEHLYYPEFTVRKTAGQVYCHCANLEQSQTTSWARFAMTPDALEALPIRSGRTCSQEICTSVKPSLQDDDICVFKEKKKSTPRECPDRQRAMFQKKCEEDFQGDDVF